MCACMRENIYRKRSVLQFFRTSAVVANYLSNIPHHTEWGELYTMTDSANSTHDAMRISLLTYSLTPGLYA